MMMTLSSAAKTELCASSLANRSIRAAGLRYPAWIRVQSWRQGQWRQSWIDKNMMYFFSSVRKSYQHFKTWHSLKLWLSSSALWFTAYVWKLSNSLWFSLRLMCQSRHLRANNPVSRKICFYTTKRLHWLLCVDKCSRCLPASCFPCVWRKKRVWVCGGEDRGVGCVSVCE